MTRIGILSLLLLLEVGSLVGQQSVLMPPQKNSTITWAPSDENIAELDANIYKVSRLRSDDSADTRTIQSPDKYFRQYVAVLGGQQRLILINAFCREPNNIDWHTKYLSFSDGGDCYWRATYNFTTGQFSHLRINGDVGK